MRDERLVDRRVATLHEVGRRESRSLLKAKRSVCGQIPTGVRQNRTLSTLTECPLKRMLSAMAVGLS